MRLFVRATELYGITEYWDTANHTWGPLAGATVVEGDDVKDFAIGKDEGNMRIGYAKISCWFPAGRWEEMPMHIRLRTVEELNAEIDRRVEQDIVESAPRERLKQGDDGYMTHLRHCYPKGGIDGDPSQPGTCKYGEDDICPGAVFDDPWGEYLRIEAEEDAKKG